MFDIIVKILGIIGFSGVITILANWWLSRKRNAIETANLIREGEVLKFELKTNLNEEIHKKTDWLEKEIVKSKAEIDELNDVISEMARERLRDERRSNEKLNEMKIQIDKLMVENQVHLERQLNCLEKLGELSRKFNSLNH